MGEGTGRQRKAATRLNSNEHLLLGRSSPLRTVGSSSHKLISRFLKRLVLFRQQKPTLARSLSGSNGANGYNNGYVRSEKYNLTFQLK